MTTRGGSLSGREGHREEACGVFGAYASFYDAFYAEKDYPREVDYLETVFSQHGIRAGAGVLDLGCGTGSHAVLLAQRGFRVLGVDRSAEMIVRAERKARESGVDCAFRVADARSTDLHTTFDAVIAMFAVMSYQCTNSDVTAAFTTARKHLVTGGLFVFDVWFGPAVLAQRPGVRTLVVTTPEGESVTRTARPKLDLVRQTVQVDYEVVRSREGVVLERIEESHTVRFFFPQELVHFLACTGFEMLALGPFLDLGREPTEADWNVSVVARAV